MVLDYKNGEHIREAWRSSIELYLELAGWLARAVSVIRDDYGATLGAGLPSLPKPPTEGVL